MLGHKHRQLGQPLGTGSVPSHQRLRWVHANALRTSIWQLQGDRVTVAAGIRLSTRKVYKVDTLEGFLAGLVLPDVEFDITNRSGRSRAVRCCRDIF